MAKASKESVDYSRGHSDAHCGICEHYEGQRKPNGSGPCEVVEGTVRYPMWCKRFRHETVRADLRRAADKHETGEY